MTPTPDQPEAWTRYWAGGMTESCFTGQKPVSFPSTWLTFAEKLSPGDNVLDLACGAGTVLRQLQVSSPSLNLMGVDFATSLPPLPGIKLHPNTRLEALPFDESSFDAVVSQFGFEYADAKPAAAEATRVLKPNGFMSLILHNSAGPAIADAISRVERLTLLRSPDGLLAALNTLAFAHAQGVETTAAETAAQTAWQRQSNADGKDETTQWALSFSHDLLKNWRQFEPAYLKDNSQKLSSEIALYAARIEAMINAGRDLGQMETLAGVFSEAGIDISKLAPLEYQNDPVAWHLAGKKRI